MGHEGEQQRAADLRLALTGNFYANDASRARRRGARRWGRAVTRSDPPAPRLIDRARTRSAYVQRGASLSRSLRRRLTQEAVGRSSCCCGAASWTSVRSARRARRSTGQPSARAIPRRARTPAKLPPRSSSTSTSGTPRRRMPQPLQPLGRHRAREGQSARSLTTEDSSPPRLCLLSVWPAGHRPHEGDAQRELQDRRAQS
jgi:hypothetical protein